MRESSTRTVLRLRDVAAKLDLSASTVSRALAGKASISAETRAAVQRAASEMGYAARRERKKRKGGTRMIGLVLGDLHNRFMSLLLEHIHDALLESGYHMTLIVDSMNSMTDAAALSQFRPLIDGYLDGLILGTVTLDSVVAVDELQQLGVPLVLVARTVDGASVDVVEADNTRGGAEAARHLYELGHRRIGLAMGPANMSTSRDRAAGALQYLQAEGLPRDVLRVVYDAYSSEAGYSCAVQMLAQPRPVTAIMAGNDSIAFGVLDAAMRMGVHVPQQLSVIGFDDVPFAASPLVGLTTIQQPVLEMARTSARRILDRVKNGVLYPATRDVFPVQLVKRNTTGTPD